jgi:hypothetical protein
MTFQAMEIVRKRRLNTKQAKRQQQDRRSDNLWKAYEYSLECDAYVYLAIKSRRTAESSHSTLAPQESGPCPKRKWYVTHLGLWFGGRQPTFSRLANVSSRDTGPV